MEVFLHPISEQEGWTKLSKLYARYPPDFHKPFQTFFNPSCAGSAKGPRTGRVKGALITGGGFGASAFFSPTLWHILTDGKWLVDGTCHTFSLSF